MKKSYINKKFKPDSLNKIQLVNEIISEYEQQGYELTLRQVYYQLVARGYIENSERSYKNLGNLINDARLAGMIDWDSIIDRTRTLLKNSHWSNPASVVSSARYSYMLDRWVDQPNYVEVWVEKDALVGIVNKICKELDVPCFSCRGYTSQSEMFNAAQRFIRYSSRNKKVIIHLGDHDPSGIDMTRDIQARLNLFEANVEVKRVALTMKQIKKYSPPPNPTKVTDARAKQYIEKYGTECWELDALEPSVISKLIKTEVMKLMDLGLFKLIEKKEKSDIKVLDLICEKYHDVEAFLLYKDEMGNI